jgi:hypothetical protein
LLFRSASAASASSSAVRFGRDGAPHPATGSCDSNSEGKRSDFSAALTTLRCFAVASFLSFLARL